MYVCMYVYVYMDVFSCQESALEIKSHNVKALFRCACDHVCMYVCMYVRMYTIVAPLLNAHLRLKSSHTMSKLCLGVYVDMYVYMCACLCICILG